MPTEASNRLQGVEEYYFSLKLKEIAKLQSSGKAIINLGIGSPDLAPDASVNEVLSAQSNRPDTHAYQSYIGLPALREAWASFYQTWYQAELDPLTEVLLLMGSKEGIMHLSMAFINPGDEVLVPNPGYPTYASASRLAGGVVRTYDLDAENNWLPDLESLGREDLSNVKIMWINYPHMPTGALATPAFFDDCIRFAREHNLILAHDNPYSFIRNQHPISLLSRPGAKEVAVELNSLSKSHNMAGWRQGVMAGSPAILSDVLRFKSNMDSGMFAPSQSAAAQALSLGQDWFDHLNKVYREREERVYALMDALECSYDPDSVGMFVWGKVPDHVRDGYELSDQILYGNDVFITPGGIFGSQGDRYIRISLCAPVSTFDTALERLKTTAAIKS
ncbi:MAG: aminotransferase class I/II-fold pyridoxal phosphate-dependent enzyme [Saprospiraceae bacterium]|nr:aminotransferase class I/II-fold pyridoxal phosphate-dependent enzyme [Saprospiraceae bacterium]MCB9319765.1 aminotransferase class I/II-fold pyridoxal phosphate-dependent enzyme [Lewinellaceae bacterium]